MPARAACPALLGEQERPRHQCSACPDRERSRVGLLNASRCFPKPRRSPTDLVDPVRDRSCQLCEASARPRTASGSRLPPVVAGAGGQAIFGSVDTVCPTCELEQPDGGTECLRCGVVFAKLRERAEAAVPDGSVWTMDVAPAAPVAPPWKLVGLGAVAAVIAHVFPVTSFLLRPLVTLCLL